MTKMHYPPRAEDGATLLERVLDKAIEATKPIQELAGGLKACAVELTRLGQAVAVLAHNQAVHHHIIQQMYSFQQHFFKKMSEHSMDMSMPDIDTPKKVDPKDEAAAAKRKAENKPN